MSTRFPCFTPNQLLMAMRRETGARDFKVLL
jgi:hypothetical protein